MTASKDHDREVGARIRRLRVMRGMRQEELAAPDYSASYLSRIESGARPASRQLLEELAARLGTTADHLLTGVDPALAENSELKIRYAELSLRSGEASEARVQFEAALASAVESQSESLELRARLGIGQADEALGDLDAAVASFHRVTEAAAPGTKTWVDGSLGLVRCYRDLGDIGKSIEVGESALQQLRAMSDWPTTDGVRALASLQASYQERGDLHYAARLAGEAVEIAGRLDDRRAMASALWNTSLLNAQLGSAHDAATTAEYALALLSELDADRDLIRLRVALARLYSLDGRATEALRVLDDSRAAVESLAVAADSAFWHHERARALLQLGELTEAASESETALELLGDEPRLTTADIYLTLGRIETVGGRAGISEWFQRAAHTLIAVGLARPAAKIWTELAAQLDASGDIAGARDAYRAAAACAGLIAAPAVTPTAIHSSELPR